VTRNAQFLLLAALLIVGCNRGAPQSKDAIRAGIMEHLAKNTGLDMSQMTVEVGDVKFEPDKAIATVAFRPKTSPDAGMTMNYTLDRQGNKWVVAKSAGSTGSAHGGAEGPSGAPAPAAPPSGGDLPPGHPPISKPDPPKK
jgi:hypothetical protein